MLRFEQGPPPAHTGAFGEPTCRTCHAGDDTPDDPHAVGIAGLPERWRPDSVYQLTLTLRGLGAGRGGFQLSTRFVGDSLHGRQAGTLEAIDDRVAVVPVAATGVSYAQHTLAQEPAASDSSISWAVRWTSPSRSTGDVALDLAANVANGDASPFGDRIYVRRVLIRAPDVRGDRSR